MTPRTFAILFTALAFGVIAWLLRPGGGSEIVVHRAGFHQVAGQSDQAVVFMAMQNSGRAAKYITGVESAISDDISLHAHGGSEAGSEAVAAETGAMRRANGFSGPGVRVDAGALLIWDANGAHILLRNLKHAVAEGERVPITLVFSDGSKQTVPVAVAPPSLAHAHQEGASAASATVHAAHDHSQMMELPPGGPIPAATLRIERDPGGGFNLHVETSDFRFAPENVNGAHVAGEGHAHLYAGAAKLARLYGPWFHLASVPDGTQRLRVGLYTNDHKAYSAEGKPIIAEAELPPAQ